MQAPPTLAPQFPQPQPQPGQLSVATLPPNVGTWSGQAVPSIHGVPGPSNSNGAGNVPPQPLGVPTGINPADFGINPADFGIDPAQFGGLRPGAFGGLPSQPVQPPPNGIPPLVDRHLAPTATQLPRQPGSARIIEEYDPNYPDPDRVDPFPFLLGGSPVSSATVIPPGQTLPPNIVLAPDNTQAGTSPPWQPQPHQPVAPQQPPPPQRPPVDNWHANGWPGNQVQQPERFWPPEQQQPLQPAATSPPVVVSNELPERVDITPESSTATDKKNTSQKPGDSFPIQVQSFRRVDLRNDFSYAG